MDYVDWIKNVLPESLFIFVMQSWVWWISLFFFNSIYAAQIRIQPSCNLNLVWCLLMIFFSWRVMLETSGSNCAASCWAKKSDNKLITIRQTYLISAMPHFIHGRGHREPVRHIVLLEWRGKCWWKETQTRKISVRSTAWNHREWWRAVFNTLMSQSDGSIYRCR